MPVAETISWIYVHTQHALKHMPSESSFELLA